MVNVLVTGAKGQLGTELQKLSQSFSHWTFIFTDVDTLDITNPESLNSFLLAQNIRYIINCAAYTAVDKAETDMETAALINTIAVKNLVAVASKMNAVLLHVSTDYVFDGNACKPYNEDSPVNPVSIYGKTKYEGELEALKYKKSIIIRTSWLYAASGNNFVKTMLRLGAERDELKVIFDQTGTPTFAGDLANAILDIITFSEYNGVKPGIYHFSNEGVCSWYDFAWEIITFAKLKSKVIPIESKDFSTPVKRPFFSVLNKGKIKNTFNLSIPHWKTSLYNCLDTIINS